MTEARRGGLYVRLPGGLTAQAVTIEGETPTKYRVRAVGEAIRLPKGRHGVRIVLRSGTVLVPKSTVQIAAAP